MSDILLSPLVAFPVVFAAVGVLCLLAGRLSFRKGQATERTTPPYACGEELPSHLIQPSYKQFLPFAFFFTLLHVLALMATTMTAVTANVAAIAVMYILAAVVGLLVLYRGR